MANYAYTALKFQGLSDLDIVYLSEEESSLVDGKVTLSTIRQAILGLANSESDDVTDVLIYLVDHGGDQVFKLDETTVLRASDLRVWLDELQAASSLNAVLIYDACEAGSFVAPLASGFDGNRLVITSSSPKQPAVFALDGYSSFSSFFWSSFLIAADLSESEIIASRAVSFFFNQEARFDADGNGVSNEKSDKLAIRRFDFGRGAAQASDFPVIGNIIAPSELNGETSFNISIDKISGATEINAVWVFVESPDRLILPSDEAITDIRGLALTKQEDGSWAGTLDDFDVRGEYEVSVIAENKARLLSLPTDENPSSIVITQLNGREPISDIDSDDDGTGDYSDTDDDNDGVIDSNDAFPLISLNGRTDTDDDGYPNDCDDDCLAVGMVGDADDDNDGVVDSSDAFPLDASRHGETDKDGFSFDVDENLEAQPLTDGLLVIRHLFGFSGDSLTSGAVSGEAGRDSSEAIAGYLTDADSELDMGGMASLSRSRTVCCSYGTCSGSRVIP